MINIQKNILLAPFTTFKIGGPAKFFAEVKSEEEIMEALEYAKENNLEFFILGGGSNILINDKGFNGLVIKLQVAIFKFQNDIIECGAGLNLSEAVKLSGQNSLMGLEWAAGIPGTIGGAIRGNAGAFGECMADNIFSVKVLETGSKKIKVFKKEDCQFGYRDSIFKQDNNLIILSCILKLEKGNKAEIGNKIKEIIKKRTASQPQGFASAGSFFKNPVVENERLIARFEKEKKVKCQGGKIPAGWLIDEVGILAKKIGGAMVSEKHGNFVINTGGAKAEDVIMLSSFIKQKVRRELDVQLQEEIQYVGF